MTPAHSFVLGGSNPMHFFAIRAVASLTCDATKASLRRYRTALCTTLTAAGLDMSNLEPQPSAPFSDEPRVFLVWHDVVADALRVFAVPNELVDETTDRALSLLDGTVVVDLDQVPIEDVDAIARLAALLGAGDDAAHVHAALVEPRLHRYDDDFVAPTVEDLEELWEQFFPYYLGGTSTPPRELDAWIGRAYAFGFGVPER